MSFEEGDARLFKMVMPSSPTSENRLITSLGETTPSGWEPIVWFSLANPRSAVCCMPYFLHFSLQMQSAPFNACSKDFIWQALNYEWFLKNITSSQSDCGFVLLRQGTVWKITTSFFPH